MKWLVTIALLLALPLNLANAEDSAQGESCPAEPTQWESPYIELGDKMLLCDAFSEPGCKNKEKMLNRLASKYEIPLEQFKKHDALKITCSLKTFVISLMAVDLTCYKRVIVDGGYDVNKVIRDGDFYGTSFDVAKRRLQRSEDSSDKVRWMKVAGYIKMHGGKPCSELCSCEY